MKRKLKIILGLTGVALIGQLGFWHWQAKYAQRLFHIDVPQWVAGGGPVSYTLVIGKSQIRNYGTVWKRTVGTTNGIGFEINEPIYNDNDVRKYLKRQKPEPPTRPKEEPRGTLL